MATYRAYAVNDDGHFVGVRVLAECRTDDEAINAARELANGCGVQVWALGRFVATLPPEDHPTGNSTSPDEFG